MLFAVIWGTLFMRWQYMICPVKDLGVNAWSDIKCDPNPVFIWREWEIPAPLRVFLSSLVCPHPYSDLDFNR
jgi:phosphatidate cytidylyltransferase